MASRTLDELIDMLARLPGLGPRSAKRAALHLLKNRETVLPRLAQTLAKAASDVRQCSTCGNLDDVDPCHICTDPKRDDSQICVVEAVDDLWAVERSGLFRGRYHVLGGTLSAIDGIGPEELGIETPARPGRRTASPRSFSPPQRRSTARPQVTTSPIGSPSPKQRSRALPMACRSAASSTISTTVRSARL